MKCCLFKMFLFSSLSKSLQAKPWFSGHGCPVVVHSIPPGCRLRFQRTSAFITLAAFIASWLSFVCYSCHSGSVCACRHVLLRGTALVRLVVCHCRLRETISWRGKWMEMGWMLRAAQEAALRSLFAACDADLCGRHFGHQLPIPLKGCHSSGLLCLWGLRKD